MTAPAQPALDTVTTAASDPDHAQPWAELGLKEEEYAEIRRILGRRPTGAELAMYSVMWSEHCSYKSSKVHLRYFGETTTDEMRAGMLAGIGENAGVVDIGDGQALVFKMESHNHPSYIEPYQGAATGVGRGPRWVGGEQSSSARWLGSRWSSRKAGSAVRRRGFCRSCFRWPLRARPS